MAYFLKAGTVKPTETAVTRERPASTPVAKQQIHNTKQWSNCKEVFSMRFIRQILHALIEALFWERFFYAVRTKAI
jgi:hypothetical protein